jgi:hypothetical protein
LAEVKTADKTKETEEDKIKGKEGTDINEHFSLHFITCNHTEELLMASSYKLQTSV